jgi:transketolase
MPLDELKNFNAEKLDRKQVNLIANLAEKCRRDTVEMVHCAQSGHIGGALSSLDIFLMLRLCAVKDRVVISNGHISAGIYSVLANTGGIEIDEVIRNYRCSNGVYEGHPSIRVPGIEWCSGALGQGLSVASGFALATKIKNRKSHVFVLMGDGEQAKGQLQEAREFAVKYKLDNLTAIIDCNDLQASGWINDIMPQNIKGKYEISGWDAIKAQGHDYNDIYRALKRSMNTGKPTVILFKTIMGKGIRDIENNYEYHGRLLEKRIYDDYMKNVNINSTNLSLSEIGSYERKNKVTKEDKSRILITGEAVTYNSNEKIDCRSAFGRAMADIISHNEKRSIRVIDCDLAESVRIKGIKEEFPDSVIECGIQEANAISVAGALSKAGIVVFYAGFGVFAIDEAYSQHRMNDINNTSVKLICTHAGLDVGEDGKTHQCTDYISLMMNLYGFKILIPSDANQTDKIIRYITNEPGNIAVIMGRSKVPILADENGKELFGKEYRFFYGLADWIRKGTDVVIVTCGNMVFRAVKVAEILRDMKISAGVLNVTSPGHLDMEKIELSSKTGMIVTYEDHNVKTGLGSLVSCFLTDNGIGCELRRYGITSYGGSGNVEQLYKKQDLDEESIARKIYQELYYKMGRRDYVKY